MNLSYLVYSVSIPFRLSFGSAELKCIRRWNHDTHNDVAMNSGVCQEQNNQFWNVNGHHTISRQTLKHCGFQRICLTMTTLKNEDKKKQKISTSLEDKQKLKQFVYDELELWIFICFGDDCPWLHFICKYVHDHIYIKNCRLFYGLIWHSVW